MSAIFDQENSNSLRGTFACFKYRRKPSSSGRRMSKAWPAPPSPRAVRPTRWMYSYHQFKLLYYELKYKQSEVIMKKCTFGSSGGSNWTIQSTAGMSRPLAATSVHNNIPLSALQNWKKVVVLFVCCCLPLNFKTYD